MIGTIPGPPRVPDPTTATNPPARLEWAETQRCRNAANTARRRYPGPVGELLARELDAFADFGFRVSQGALMQRLVAELLAPPQAPGGVSAQ